MFSVTDINFSNGVYGSNGGVNGAEVFLLQSSENADTVISDFERLYYAGLDPNNLFENIMRNRNLTRKDFTDRDAARVKRRVEEIYKSTEDRGVYY